MRRVRSKLFSDNIPSGDEPPEAVGSPPEDLRGERPMLPPPKCVSRGLDPIVEIMRESMEAMAR